SSDLGWSGTGFQGLRVLHHGLQACRGGEPRVGGGIEARVEARIQARVQTRGEARGRVEARQHQEEEALRRHVRPHEAIRAAVAGPGFINFVLAEEQLASAVAAVLAAGERYGRSDGGGRAGQPVNVEFVSANPTGPLHVGHGRQAALGDAIAAVLEWTGWRVTREFYYNDGGAQIANLARSEQARSRELRGQVAGLAEGGSPGEDIRQSAGA